MQPQIKLLGGHALATPGGAPVRLPTRKSWALLAYLVQSHEREVPREELATLLWSRSGDEQARASLRQELAVLKKALARAKIPPFRADKDFVRFPCPPGIADTTEIEAGLGSGDTERLRRLAGLYAGDLLSGLNIRSGPFEEWLWLERQRLKNRVLGAMADVLRADETLGEAGRILASARAMLAIDATQEQPHRAMMRQFYRSGRRAEALQQFEACRAALRRDLDTEPSQKTVDLAERIRRAASIDGKSAGAGPSRHPATFAQFQGVALCIGLHGADALGPEFPPEKLAAGEDVFTRRAQQIVARHGGITAAGPPGKITAVFGVGADGTHRIEQAVSAALAVVAEPFAFAPDLDVRPRAGLSLGLLAMAGDKTDDATGATGVPVYVAAALESAAERGEVLIDGPLFRRIGHVFDVEKRPADRLSGCPPYGPVTSVRQEKLNGSRFDTPRPDQPPFVAREAEVEALASAWAEAVQGRGGAISVIGEAGIGKSRLVHRFLESTLRDDPCIVQLHAAPADRRSPLAALAEILRQDMQLPHGATRAEVERRSAQWAAGLDADLQADLPAIVTVLHCGQGGDGSAPHPVTVRLFKSVLRARADGRPQIVVADDLNWFDSRTAAVLREMLDDVRSTRLLVVTVFRPGTEPAWHAQYGYPKVELPPLAPKDARRIASSMLPDTVPAKTVEAVLEKAGGVPLLIEEFALSVAEALRNASGPAAADCPATMQSALTSRLDRLSASARDVLQIASVLGTTVTRKALMAITALPADGLDARLRQLLEGSLLFPVGRATRRRYDFKHVLVQEAVYASMLPARRKACHLRVAEVLEAADDIGAELGPEHVARHFARAGRPRKAIAFWQAAGQRAAGLSGHAEAASHYRAALGLLSELPESDDRRSLELRLLLALGPQVQAARGYASRDVAKVYDRARVIAAEGGDGRLLERLEPVLAGLWGNYITRAKLDAAIGVAAEFLAEAQAQGDPVSQSAGQYMLGVGRFYRGHLTAAQEYFTRARTRYAASPRGALIDRYGIDMGVNALCYEAWTAALCGRKGEADAKARQALDEAAATGHEFTRLTSQVLAAGAYAFAGQSAASLALAETAEAAARALGQTQWRALARMQIGRATWVMGKPGGPDLLQDALDDYRSSGAALAVPYAKVWLAECCLAEGATDRAMAHLDEAAAHVSDTGEAYFDPEISRLRGCVLAGAGSSEAAEADFAAAIDAARRSGAGLLGLRARISLAEFLKDSGRAEGALGELEAALARAPDPEDADASRARRVREEILSQP